MFRITLLAAMLSPTLYASPVSCVTDTLYQEARGVSAEEMALVGFTVVNEQKRTKNSICAITKANYEQRTPNGNEYGLYEHIANGVVSSKIPDLSGGADHFNEGKTPAMPGQITRQTKHFVFYKIAERRRNGKSPTISKKIPYKYHSNTAGSRNHHSKQPHKGGRFVQLGRNSHWH